MSGAEVGSGGKRKRTPRNDVESYHYDTVKLLTPTTMVEIIIRKRHREDAVFTQRKFFKKTARGKVVKGTRNPPQFINTRSRLSLVIRERYLRDDVSCGIEMCRECISSPVPRLPFSGAGDHKLFPNGHFVLPDTNVFLSQVCSLYHGETFLL